MGGRLRSRHLAIVAAGAAVLSLLAGLGDARADGAASTLAAECVANDGDDRLCASLAAGGVLAESVCEDGGVPADACAALNDEVAVSEARLAEFEAGWVHRALRLQSRLDEHEPLRNTLWPHTHNSANSTAYAPSLSMLDPNQHWSILDQLRMGVRAIELDLHPDASRSEVVLCHGRTEGAAPATVHVGCSVDRPLADGLAELRAFLDRPGNEREVVLLYLENQLEGDQALHDQVGAALDAAFGSDAVADGSLVARPPSAQPCAPMPLDRSRADLLAAGHRVLIVGNCGPGSWGTWVHERGPDWHERSLGDGFDCEAERDRTDLDFEADWIRVYEDATWLSAMADGRYRPQTADDVRAMVACGVDMVGFDRLDPADGRLEALVWSWAPDEPRAEPGLDCVAYGADARFRAVDCRERRAFACRTPTGDWVVSERAGRAGQAGAACARLGAVPATPPTGWESARLADAAAGRELWLPLPNPA